VCCSVLQCVAGINSYQEKPRSGRHLVKTIEEKHGEKQSKTQPVSYRHTFRISFVQPQSTRRQFSPRAVSRVEEERCVVPHSMTDLRVVPETSLIVTIKHQYISESHRNSKSPSGGSITNDQCLHVTHIRDAAHSESNKEKNLVHQAGCGYRLAKTHRIPYRYRSFSAQEPCI